MKTVLEIVQAKTSSLDITNEQRQEAIDEVAVEIANYCNLPGLSIPGGLTYTHANMAVELLNATYAIVEPFVKSINEGDTAVTFELSKPTDSRTQASSVLANYTAQLNKFRKVKW